MSRYDWEAGTIKLSTKEFPKVRKAVWEAANSHRAARLERAMALWIALSNGAKRETFTHENDELLLDAMFREVGTDAHGNKTWVSRKTPLKPLKKDYGPLPWKTLVFHDDWHEGVVRFDPKARTVRWGVGENNRAVERARGTWLGKAFFRALDRVVWTRGTGGEIVGNDEYNRDSEDSGGGSNYVTATYPPRTPNPRLMDTKFWRW